MSDPSKTHMNRRALLAGLMTTAAGTAMAGAPLTSVRPAMRPQDLGEPGSGPGFDAILSGAKLSGDKSILLVDLASGRVLEADTPAKTLPPASVAKTVTSLYALTKLGAGHHYATRVLATGPVVDGIVQGDLVLIGAGDPHLDSDSFGELAGQLADAGITGVTGAFRIYDGALPRIDQIADDQPENAAYNPALSGLILNFNRVYFEWKRQKGGYDLSLTSHAVHYRPAVDVIKVALADRNSPTYAYSQTDAGEEWSVRQSALRFEGSRWLPVRRPFPYAAEAFIKIAAEKGITLPPAQRTEPVSGTTVAEVQSIALPDMLHSMLYYSTNITAEAVGLKATASAGTMPQSLSESAAQMTEWARATYGLQDSHFVDHCGLGDASRVSARDLVKVLRTDGWDGQLRPLLKKIKLKDEHGRLLTISGAEVEAKTGTLNFTSALAGFIACPNGRRLAFAIFTSDLEKRAAIPPEQRERPRGGRIWLNRSRRMQQALLRRWINVYGI